MTKLYRCNRAYDNLNAMCGKCAHAEPHEKILGCGIYPDACCPDASCLPARPDDSPDGLMHDRIHKDIGKSRAVKVARRGNATSKCYCPADGSMVCEHCWEPLPMKPQTRAVYKHLASGGTLTQFEALQELGVGRLSARIQELRELGFQIVTERVKVPKRNGSAVVARYRMV